MDLIPFQHVFQKKTAQVARQKSLDDTSKRVHLRNTFVRWIRSVSADLPFVSLTNLHINYLIQAHFDNKLSGVNFEKSGLQIPLDGPDLDSDTVNNALDPNSFFKSMTIEHRGVSYTALERQFWEMGRSIDGFSIPKMRGTLDVELAKASSPTPSTPSTPNSTVDSSLLNAYIMKMIHDDNKETKQSDVNKVKHPF